MRYTVMAYAADGYQEFILPEIRDADYEFILDRRIFGLRQSYTICMENIDGVWKFRSRRYYSIRTYEGQPGTDTPLDNGMVFEFLGLESMKISLVILCSENAYPFYRKYCLDGVSQITIGKEETSSIIYDFRSLISRNHAVLYLYEGKWVLQDNSSNGTYLNGARMRGQAILNFGDRITLFGLRLIYLGQYLAVCALSGTYEVRDVSLRVYHPREGLILDTEEKPAQKKRFFKRAPRTMAELYTEPIEIEAPPQLNRTKKRPLLMTIGPSLTMALPMLLGCLVYIYAARSRGTGSSVYMFTGVITAVTSAVIGVVWALMNLRYNDTEEEEEERRYNAYGQYLIQITDFIKQKYEENRQALYAMYITGEECCRFTREEPRLWNRNEHQKDFLSVRLGTGNIPFQAEIRIPKEKFSLIRDDLAEKPALIRDSYSSLVNVPVCVDLREKGLVGIIGGPGKRGAYDAAFNIIAQLAANNSYTDVKLGFIYRGTSANRERFSFARWLPHVWMEDKKTRLIAGDKAQVGDILYELASVVRQRTEDQQQKTEYPLPHYILFVDDSSLLEGELLENQILHPSPAYGITTVLLAKEYRDLPNTCEFIIQNDGQGSGFFHVFHEMEENRELVMERVSGAQLETLARTLCDIEVNETASGGEIPDALDFFEMYGVRSLDQLGVVERWKKNRNYETMRVPIGAKNGGNLCYLDIHEKYHGPHGLVAGTTGSGKSETLQTYILSLAVNFSPDDIAFFIIDFKGGGMANLFSNLPHMAGQISNLSGNQVRRAMISIKSENRRRQQIFAEHNVNNINLYTKLYKSREAGQPVPHLFIIIDEFAELKREEPEFMKELISVAQVGRSLGVHLILATQKPSGTVDDNIWSNSKFRLCLRVQDRQDSNDMLHKPDAAYITQAGRGFLQVGSDEIYEQFQSGFSGAEYIDDPGLNRSEAALQLTLTGRVPARSNVKKKVSGRVKAITQLDAVIDYLNQIADQWHYDRRMLMWLPVLPERIYLSELPGYEETGYAEGNWPAHEGGWALKTMVGLYDDPVHQAQDVLNVDFAETGHLAVCGTVATGKSTFLQTLLYGLIFRCSPAELNFYILDYSSRMLLPFADAPHCGGVVIDTDEDKVEKFFFLMNRMIGERRDLFGGAGYEQYLRAERSRRRNPLPAVLVVIDNYSNFREKTGCKYDDDMVRLSREGVGYGIFLVITAGGFGANELPTRVGDNMRTVISLEMGDKFKYAEVLRTTRVEIMPETDVRGRGLAYVDGAILEFQTAMAFAAETMYDMAERIVVESRGMAASWKGTKARPIPVIPENPVFADFCQLEEYQNALANPRYLPFAYASQDASVYSANLWTAYCYLIQGKARTGKKNVMKAMLYAAAKAQNAQVCVIELKGMEFQTAAEQLGVTWLGEEKAVYEFFKGTIPVFQERNARKRAWMAEGLDTLEIAERMSAEKRIFIFLADVADFVSAVYHPAEGVGSMYAYLENITEKGENHGFCFIGLINPEQAAQIAGRGIYVNMASYKTGIHLGGNLNAQRLFQFTNLSFQEQQKVTKPGSGYAADPEDSGVAEAIVLPLVKGGF
ncbi:MAG: type VII secretion protein EssC [Lachnospiraceae bacterium]|nr:type VII secretion protein EssC [Lachnospiraceae bacterium]